MSLSTTQASQSKPVELENALHMRKPHLDLLAEVRAQAAVYDGERPEGLA
jgi:hypothetical protein